MLLRISQRRLDFLLEEGLLDAFDQKLKTLVGADAANHGDRMAIEFFEVDARQGAPTLHWKGCAPLPAGTLPNAVTTLPDGGLLVISFYDPNDAQAWTRMAAGQNTGRRGWESLFPEVTMEINEKRVRTPFRSGSTVVE